MPAPDPLLPPAKKRKVDTEQNDDLQHIHRLENLLLTAVAEGTSLNPLVDLLDTAKNARDPHLLFKSIYALYRVFASTIDARMLVSTPDPNAKVVRAWIFERLNLFTDMLVGLMSDSEKSLRVSILQSVHPSCQQQPLDLSNTNPLFPSQALVVFFVLKPACLGTFNFV